MPWRLSFDMVLLAVNLAGQVNISEPMPVAHCLAIQHQLNQSPTSPYLVTRCIAPTEIVVCDCLTSGDQRALSLTN